MVEPVRDTRYKIGQAAQGQLISHLIIVQNYSCPKTYSMLRRFRKLSKERALGFNESHKGQGGHFTQFSLFPFLKGQVSLWGKCLPREWKEREHFFISRFFAKPSFFSKESVRRRMRCRKELMHIMAYVVRIYTVLSLAESGGGAKLFLSDQKWNFFALRHPRSKCRGIFTKSIAIDSYFALFAAINYFSPAQRLATPDRQSLSL